MKPKIYQLSSRARRRCGALILVAAGMLPATGCHKPSPIEPPAGQILLRIGERVVTSAELEAEIQRMTPEARALYATPEARLGYVKQIIEQEILLEAAEARGYRNDPAVVEATKRAMVLKLLRERIGTGPAPGETTEAALRQYYEEHAPEFGPPAITRVQAVLLPDRTRALALRTEIERAATGRAAAERLATFERLAQQSSPGAGRRDLDVSERYEPAGQPKALFDAAWALTDTGQLSPVLETPDGFYLLQLKQRTPRSTKPFDQVKSHILRTLSDQARDRRVQALVAELRKDLVAQVFSDNFSSVQFENGAVQGTQASALIR